MRGTTSSGKSTAVSTSVRFTILMVIAAVLLIGLSVSAIAACGTPSVNSLYFAEQDMFYSSYPGNNIITLKAAGCVPGGDYMEANFTGILGCGNITMVSQGGGVYNATCDVTVPAASANFDSGTIVLMIKNSLGIPQGQPNITNVILYNMTTPDFGPCNRMGGSSTSMVAVTNFSDVPFTIELQAGGTDLGCPPAFGLNWNGWLSTIKINWTSLNMNNESIGTMLAGLALPQNMNVEISPPNDFGQTSIFMNSQYFAGFHSAATVTFYNLPFDSLPNVTGAELGAVQYNYKGWNDTFHTVVGDLIFDVGGFSDYNASDILPPEVKWKSPDNGTSDGSTPSVSVLINGTGTPVSLAQFLIDGTLVALFNQTNASHMINTANCYNLTNGGELYNCTFAPTLTVGTHTLTVVANDFGGSSPGNSVLSAITYTASDTISPVVRFITPTQGSLLTSNNGLVWFNVTDNFNVSLTNKFKLTENGANRGPLSCSGTDTVQTCSYNPSVVALAEGIVVLNATANDTTDNMNSTAITFTVDTQNPYYVSYGASASGNVAQGSIILLSANFTDTATGVNLSLYKNGALVINNGSYVKGSNFTYAYTVSDQIGTTLNFYWTGTDLAMHMNQTGNLSITVADLTPPSVTWVSPANNTRVGPFPMTMTFNVSDNYQVNVSATTVTLDWWKVLAGNQNFTCSASGTTQMCTVTLPLAMTAGAGYTVDINTSDVGGNIYRLGVYFPVDEEAPTIALISPANNSWSASTLPVLTYNATDRYSSNDSCTLTINSYAYAATVNNNTNTAVSVTAAAGLATGNTYPWYVTCTDQLGNSATSGTSFVKIDTTMPNATITLSGATANGAGWYNMPLTVTINSSDANSGVDQISWSNTSGSGYAKASGTGVQFVVNANLVNNYIYYKSNDTAGNVETEKQQQLKYDAIAPSVTALTPASTLVAQGAFVAVDVYTSDGISGLSSANYTFGTSTGSLSLGTGKFSGTVTAPSSDGLATLFVTVIDAAGNTVTNTTGINVNSSMPTITASQASGAVLANKTQVTVTFNNITNSWYTLNGGTQQNVAAPGVVSVTISGPEGANNLSVTANSTVATINTNFTYTVDTTAPVPTFTAPAASATVNGTLTVNVNVVEANAVASCALSLNTTSIGTDTVAPYSWTIATTAYADAGYALVVTCTDSVGNTNVAVTRAISILNNNGAATVIPTQGTVPAGYIDNGQLGGTPFAGLLYGITGLNTTSVTIIDTASGGLYHSYTGYLSTFIDAVNVTSGTSTGSTVQVLIPVSTLTGLSLSAPYSTIQFYLDDASGVTGPLTSSYVGTVVVSTITYAQFSVSVPHFSILFWGVKKAATTTTTTGGGSTTTYNNDDGYYQQSTKPVNVTAPATTTAPTTQPAPETTTQPTTPAGEGTSGTGAQPSTQPTTTTTAPTGATGLIIGIIVIAIVVAGVMWVMRRRRGF